jgi:dolichyl-phosphate beta-glucosyltransferase
VASDARGQVIDADISIVIPAFNEEHRLPATLDRLVAELPEVCSGEWEIVVCDDGSVDRTVQVVLERSSHPHLRVLSAGTNRGKGAALREGALAAVHPLVLFLDADLPVPPTTITSMIELAAECDLVIGSRRLPGASFNPPQPMVRRIGGRLFRSAVSALGYDVTSDPQCGVKLLRRDTVAPLLQQVTCGGFAFDVELIVRARRAGVQIAELPVVWSHVPGSSMRPLRDAAVTLVELVRLRGRLARKETVTA